MNPLEMTKKFIDVMENEKASIEEYVILGGLEHGFGFVDVRTTEKGLENLAKKYKREVRRLKFFPNGYGDSDYVTPIEFRNDLSDFAGRPNYLKISLLPHLFEGDLRIEVYARCSCDYNEEYKDK